MADLRFALVAERVEPVIGDTGCIHAVLAPRDGVDLVAYLFTGDPRFAAALAEGVALEIRILPADAASHD